MRLGALVGGPLVRHDAGVNEESLARVNAFLSAVSERTEVGAVLEDTPAEIGRDLGFPDPLSTARAVRALIARKRLEPAMGSYRLLDPRPVAPGEKESLGRPPRKPRKRAAPVAAPRARDGSGGTTYSDVGRAAVDRLLELGTDAGTLRAGLRSAREEAREARQARDEAVQRARLLSDRVRDLEARAEMAESNLRTLLAQARAKDAPRENRVPDSEMEAILGVLRTGDDDLPAAPEGSHGEPSAHD